jgi:uncharacterized protein YndB with AHSA1/START domain
MYPALHITQSIRQAPKVVYAFASNPENLPRWAAGLSGASIVRSGDSWLCQSPMGEVKVKFVEGNPFGVMDHDVTLPNGEVNHNPFRVLANGNDSEVVFTLYKLPRMSDQEFEQDAALIRKDLETLRSLLEP